jgi:hypothetical protein
LRPRRADETFASTGPARPPPTARALFVTPRRSKVLLQGKRGTREYFGALQGAPRYSLGRQGTPCYPRVPSGTPGYSMVRQGTPGYPRVPSGTPGRRRTLSACSASCATSGIAISVPVKTHLRRNRCAVATNAANAATTYRWYSRGTHGVLTGYSRGTHGVLAGYSRGTHGVLTGYSQETRREQRALVAGLGALDRLVAHNHVHRPRHRPCAT